MGIISDLFNKFNNPEKEPSSQPNNENVRDHFAVQYQSVEEEIGIMEKYAPNYCEAYKKRLNDVQQSIIPGHELEAIEEYDAIIKEIKRVSIIAKRILTNVEMKKLAVSYREYLDDTSKTDEFSHPFMSKQEVLLWRAVEGEEKLKAEEDEVVLDIGKLVINSAKLESIITVLQDSYADSLIETDYRYRLLEIARDMVVPYYYGLDNPFSQFEGNKEKLVGLLEDDVKHFMDRFKAFEESQNGKPKSPKYIELESYKNDLEYRMDWHNARGEDGTCSTFMFEDEEPVECFYKMAQMLVKATLTLNHLELSQKIEELNEQVINDAEKKLGRTGKKSVKKSDDKELIKNDERWEHQLHIARELGLITDDNLVSCLEPEIYTARGALGIIRKAEKFNADIVVLPSVGDKSFTYRVISKFPMKRTKDNVPPLREVEGFYAQGNHYVGKLLGRDIDIFTRLLKDERGISRSLDKVLRYQYDSLADLYYFYFPLDYDRNITISEEVQNEIRLSYNLAVAEIRGRDNVEPYSTHMFPYFSLPTEVNMVAILEKLSLASIRYFVEYDADNHEKPINVFVDPNSIEKVGYILRNQNLKEEDDFGSDSVSTQGWDDTLKPTIIQREFVKRLEQDDSFIEEEGRRLDERARLILEGATI